MYNDAIPVEPELMEAHINALQDKIYWNIPYEWDEEYSILSAQKETDQILNAFLCKLLTIG
jgi:hypothetical protein